MFNSSLDLTSKEAKSKQYNCIDLTKFICAIFVIIIHCPPLKTISLEFNNFFTLYLAKLAVPFYFISSGYLLFRKTNYDTFDNSIIRRYIVNMLKLYILWTIIYLPQILYIYVLNNESSIIYKIMYVIRELLYGYHFLWYLMASVVGVILLSVCINKKMKIKNILILGIILYCIGLLGQSYFGLMKPLQKCNIIWNVFEILGKLIRSTNNGVFFAFLFIGMGMLFAWKPINITFANNIIWLTIFMILGFIEVYFVQYYNLARAYDMYVFLIPVSFLLFYMIAHIDLKDNPIYKELRNIGIIIFFIHKWIIFIVGKILEIIFTKLGFQEVNSLIYFIIVLSISTIIAILVNKMSQKEKFKFIKKLY